jgi:hypothetical protein
MAKVARTEGAVDLAPAVIADLISRLRDVADPLKFEGVVAVESEHQLALELGKVRCLETAVMSDASRPSPTAIVKRIMTAERLAFPLVKSQ